MLSKRLHIIPSCAALRSVASLLGCYLLLCLVDTAHAQADTESDKTKSEELEAGLAQVLRFHDDWRAHRKPLSVLKQRAINHRELTIDDFARRLSFPPRGDAPEAEESAATNQQATSDDDLPKFAEARASAWTTDANKQLFLKSADELIVGHPDCEADYQCMCKPEYTYNAIRTSALDTVLPHLARHGERATPEEISALPLGRFLNCYQFVNHHAGFEEQTFCRYITKLVNVNNISGVRLIGENGTHTGPIQEIYLENSVRVTPGSLLPLDRGSKYVRPLFASIDGASYFFEELFADPGVRCALTQLFDSPVVDLSKCTDSAECALAASQALDNALVRTMRTSPFLTDLDRGASPLPGERIFVRNYKRSEVLGAPFYESSQYLVRWYRNEIGHISPPGLYTYSGGNPLHVGKYLFVRIHHSLSVRASRLGDYPEGSSQQYAVYKDALDNAITSVVAEVCTELAGQLTQERICEIE